jgi:hypothetical protein
MIKLQKAFQKWRFTQFIWEALKCVSMCVCVYIHELEKSLIVIVMDHTIATFGGILSTEQK